MQAVKTLGERLPLHRNIIAEFNRRVFISACAPYFAVGDKSTPNFSPVHQWAMVVDCDIRQRNALFNLGSLADIRRLQIALCESDLSEPDNGETKSEWLKRNCIHIVAVTLPRFSILRYQIIHGCLKPPVDLHRGVSVAAENYKTAAAALPNASIVGQPHRLPASGTLAPQHRARAQRLDVTRGEGCL